MKNEKKKWFNNKETRRLTGEQTEVFKICNVYENIDRYIFLTQEIH